MAFVQLIQQGFHSLQGVPGFQCLTLRVQHTPSGRPRIFLDRSASGNDLQWLFQMSSS